MSDSSKGGFVYILASKPNGTLYVGVTSDIVKRIHQHRTGEGSEFVDEYDVTRLVHLERFDGIEQAIRREKQLIPNPAACFRSLKGFVAPLDSNGATEGILDLFRFKKSGISVHARGPDGLKCNRCASILEVYNRTWYQGLETRVEAGVDPRSQSDVAGPVRGRQPAARLVGSRTQAAVYFAPRGVEPCGDEGGKSISDVGRPA